MLHISFYNKLNAGPISTPSFSSTITSANKFFCDMHYDLHSVAYKHLRQLDLYDAQIAFLEPLNMNKQFSGQPKVITKCQRFT